MKVLFARFTRTRRPEYQIETGIVERRGTRLVYKKALTPAASVHLDNIFENYSRYRETITDVNVSLVEPQREGSLIVFPFIWANPIEYTLLKALKDRDKMRFMNVFLDYLKFLRNSFETVRWTEPSPEFVRQFGDVDLHGELTCQRISNIDLNLGNVFRDESDSYVIADYEWVYPFPIPIDFIAYRAINAFIVKYQAYLMSDFLDKRALYNIANIDDARYAQFLRMESTFQEHVHG